MDIYNVNPLIHIVAVDFYHQGTIPVVKTQWIMIQFVMLKCKYIKSR